MIILDTNVLSALMLKHPDSVVVEWLDGLPPESIWTTSVTLFEIWFGLGLMPKGKRRSALEEVLTDSLSEDLGGRVLAFDDDAARHAAALAVRSQRAGRSVEIRDVQIAGIATARRAQVATRNTRHFDGFGIRLLNPWGR